MRVHVAFTPEERFGAPVSVVVDVLRATSTISQALAAGYRRVLCCAEIEEAKALRDAEGGGILAGERKCVRIPGFDLGNSPTEFVEPIGDTVVLTTTNGTRALVTAASRSTHVLAGSLLNLGAVVEAARQLREDVVVVCAGVQGEPTIDDVYCAGRIAGLLGGDPSDGARLAIRVAESYRDAVEGLSASQSARNLVAASLDSDIAYCARESALQVVPRLVGLRETAVELAAS